MLLRRFLLIEIFGWMLLRCFCLCFLYLKYFSLKKNIKQKLSWYLQYLYYYRCVRTKWSRKINHILKHIRIEKITDTNILIKLVIIYVGKKTGLQAYESKNKKEKEPWWKRRIKKTINEVRKHINTWERHQRGEIRRNEKYEELERRYKIKKKGIKTVAIEL